MRIRYRKTWPGGVTQYVTVWSLSDEAAVYATEFTASRDADVTIGPLFPLRAAAPPGFQKPVRHFRGTNWINMSDHVGFVSVDPLPQDIPDDRFFLTGKKTHKVKKGDRFGRGVLVVYARQPHADTASLADKVRVLDDSRPGRVRLAVKSSSGVNELDIDLDDTEE
jgi:hypothetical protein